MRRLFLFFLFCSVLLKSFYEIKFFATLRLSNFKLFYKICKQICSLLYIVGISQSRKGFNCDFAFIKQRF